jgi:uncharacterized protein (TIGR02996 family)
MSAEGALLAAIQQRPDDDSTRLVYADWLAERGDADRADFIRTQIEAEGHFDGSPQHSRLIARAVELLSKNAATWANGYETAIPADAALAVCKAELAGQSGTLVLKGRKDERQGWWTELFSKLWFRRGFVEEAEFTPEQFFALSPCDIRPAGPLPTLRLQLYGHGDDSLGTFADLVRHLAGAPLLRHFQDIILAGGFHSTTEDGLRLLANEPALLAKLAGLRLSEDSVGDTAVLPILESSSLTGLRELAIDGTDCTPAVVDLLVRSDRFRGIRSLHLAGVMQGGRGLRLFAAPGRWPRLRWLVLGECGLDDLTLKGLMRARAFPALEVLDLHSNDVHRPALRALLLSGAFPRLRTLGIGGAPVTLDEVQTLRDEFGHRVDIHFPVPRRRGPANVDKRP